MPSVGGLGIWGFRGDLGNGETFLHRQRVSKTPGRPHATFHRLRFRRGDFRGAQDAAGNVGPVLASHDRRLEGFARPIRRLRRFHRSQTSSVHSMNRCNRWTDGAKPETTGSPCDLQEGCPEIAGSRNRCRAARKHAGHCRVDRHRPDPIAEAGIISGVFTAISVSGLEKTTLLTGIATNFCGFQDAFFATARSSRSALSPTFSHAARVFASGSGRGS